MDIKIDDLCNGFIITGKRSYTIGAGLRGLGLWMNIEGDTWTFRFYFTSLN